MTKWVQHFALYVLGLFFFYIPFEYKRAREESRSHAGATCYVALLYLLFVLWIGGFANALYGLGMVIDRPASIVGLIASSPAKASGKVRRAKFIGRHRLDVCWIGDRQSCGEARREAPRARIGNRLHEPSSLNGRKSPGLKRTRTFR
jgi:hypothetical protein